MVDSISSCVQSQRKSFADSFSFGTSPTHPVLVDGVVQHEHVSAAVQIAILEIVDETGSSTIGDLVRAIPHHIDVPGAVLALAGAGLLTIDLNGAILDANAIVRRTAFPSPDDSGPTPDGAPTGSLRAASVHAVNNTDDRKIFSLPVTAFHPAILVAAANERRALAKCPELQKPGVYILFNHDEYYVGYGGNTGARIGQGNQPIEM